MSKLDYIRKKSKTYFKGVTDPSHDWFHVKRVYRLSKLISKKKDVNLEIIQISALLHDIGRPLEAKGKIENHAAWGAKESEKILSEIIDEKKIEEIQHCIRSHRYQVGTEPKSLEAKIISDADNLDALGAIGIARVFSYGGNKGIPIYDSEITLERDKTEMGRTQLNHLKKKIMNIKKRIYTEEGKEIANKRESYVESFIKKLEKEINMGTE